MADAASVLVVDDDVAVGTVLAALLKQNGFDTTFVPNAQAALATLEKRPFDLVMSDVRMPGMDGFELLATLKRLMPEVPVVLLTAHGTVSMAVDAMKAGAADFVMKPFAKDEVLFCARKALGLTQGPRGAPPAQELASDDGMVGRSKALDGVKELIGKAASSQATVLILGETGTGKELAARAIHARSSRAKEPFVRLTGGAIPDTLFESELFGYEKGAFTGAVNRKPGRVELAKGGTLFLDEVGELSMPIQVKLLRLIQEREFERVGGTETLKADVRFVAATHRPLEQMVKEGSFREDLFYRLNVIPLVLPPLRERADDIEALAAHFVAQLGKTHGRPQARLTPQALAVLRAQPWPGNVRQLQNFLERLVVLASSDELSDADVQRELGRAGAPTAGAVTPPSATPPSAPGSLDEKRKDAERSAVQQALDQAKGNRALAARLLGVSRRTLYYKLEALGLK
ncbi:MAG: sigma-54-dependent Fis family transcriptional regulator [Myxococcaceae bacterium]|nr:sigma-54-dependent Fis family transcriptional regulator [Myxococcaceae bacterium]